MPKPKDLEARVKDLESRVSDLEAIAYATVMKLKDVAFAVNTVGDILEKATVTNDADC